MKAALDTWYRELARRREIAVLETLGARLEALSEGDRLILYALAGLLALASALGVLAVERSFLVTVPAYGGTLVEGEIGAPRFINPLLAISDADRDLTALTYAGLMGLDGEGNLIPVLAESYEASADGKSYTFRLRDEAVFSDGTPVSAEDIVFTVEKAQDPGLKSPEYANWSGIRAEALDARTVRFTLAKPYAPFLRTTTLGILPAHLWSSVSDEQFPFSALETAPVGAGPFVIRSTNRGSSGIIMGLSLAANPRYALGRPYLDGIRMHFYAGAEDLGRALASGAVESAYGAMGAESARRMVITKPYARVFGVFFNPSANAAFARAEVRQALSLALDRRALTEETLGGYATAIMGPVPPASGIEETPVAAPDDPTAAAAAVLLAHGWRYDGETRAWENASAKLSLGTMTIRTSNVPELRGVARAVARDWERLGIAAAIELYEQGDLSQNVIRPRKYEALLYGEVIGRDQDLYAFWSSKETADPGLNIALYANKTVDALLEDARVNPDPSERRDDLQRIEDTIAREYPAAFLYAPDFVYAIPADLKGVALPQITTPSDRFATAARWYRETDAVWPFFVPGR